MGQAGCNGAPGHLLERWLKRRKRERSKEDVKRKENERKGNSREGGKEREEADGKC